MISGAPVYQVEVEIVLESRCIEYLAGQFVDFPYTGVVAVFAESEGVMHLCLLPQMPPLPVTQDVGVLEGQQLLLAATALAA